MSGTRLARLRARMAAQGLEAVVIVKPENRRYMSGFTGSAGLLLITESTAQLFTDSRYNEQAAAQAPAFEVQKVAASLFAAAADQLPSGIRRVGFEGDYISYDEHGAILQTFGGRELISIAGTVEMLRLVKDADEQALMQRAAAIADQAWSEIIALVQPGVAERDLAVELEYRLRKLGGEGPAFDFIVASGVRSSLPHGRASAKLIETGDLVTFDFGTIYGGYCSDMTRTVMVGEPDAKQRQIYETVLQAQVAGVAACRPGISGKDLDEVCRSIIRAEGFGDYFGHGTGHGVGLQIHEGPKVSVRGEQDLLEPGMVVTIEPGIYIPAWGGVRIEDIVLVTETGSISLSRSPKDLLIL